MRPRVCFLFIILLFSGVVYAQESDPKSQATPETAPAKGYMLGPGDKVAGNVNTEIGYEFVTTVDDNGMIYLPFIKTPIFAQCRTETEVRSDIESEIRKYIREPRLNFRIDDKFKSRPPVTVYGEINKPSEITLTRKATLLELLAATGGDKEQEASGLVEVRRPRTPMCMAENDPDNWKTTSSRIFKLADIKAGKADSNPVIYPGDVIHVQRAAPVHITGEVVAPQGVFLKERGLSLSEGLAMVGNVLRLKPGATPESKDRELISANFDLIRKGKQKDIMLQPYDIVVVEKAKDPIWLAIVKTGLNAGKTFTSAAASVIPASIVY
jgi:polysaccharide biosynthesis/export protein